MELADARDQVSTSQSESRDLKVRESGGIYAWRDLFLVLRASWSEDLFPDLGIPAVADRAPLDRIAERLVETVDRIDAQLPTNPRAEAIADFHVKAEAAVVSAIGDLERILGPTFATRVYDFGVLRDTSTEWAWSIVLDALIELEAGMPGTVSGVLGISSEDADLLLSRVDGQTEAVWPDLLERRDHEDKSDWRRRYFARRPRERESLIGLALDFLRWAKVRAMLEGIGTVCSRTVIESLVSWARREATRLGIEEEVAERMTIPVPGSATGREDHR